MNEAKQQLFLPSYLIRDVILAVAIKISRKRRKNRETQNETFSIRFLRTSGSEFIFLSYLHLHQAMLEIPRQMNERPFDLFVAFFSKHALKFSFTLGTF